MDYLFYDLIEKNFNLIFILLVTDKGTFGNDSTYNEYSFKKHMNLTQNNTIDSNDYDFDDKKASFFPPLH